MILSQIEANMNRKAPANLSYSDFLLIDTQASGVSASQPTNNNDWSLPNEEAPVNSHVTETRETDCNISTNSARKAWNTIPQSTIIVATEQSKKKKASPERGSSSRKSTDNAQEKTSSTGSPKASTGEQREVIPKSRISVTQQKEPTYYIGGGNGAALIDRILSEMGWKRVTEKYNENYKLKWVEARSMINYGSFREGEQLVNRIPNCSLLTNKLGLLNSLQRYDRVNATINSKRNVKMKSSDFLPETYRLDDPIDRKLFLETYQEGETWICKPAGMNQGRGIYLVRDIDEFQAILEERDEKIKKSKRPGVERIVQRYIENPLLLEGRKFDVRAYMLIGCTAPYLILYHKGYVRRCLHDYKVDDNNLMIHLTNQFVQKRDAEYKTNLEDTVWSMDKFNDYINIYVAPEKGLQHDWVYTVFTTRMKQIMLFCFNAVKHKLKCRMGYFDLYGLDFMIDEQMKIWLIEINSNPCLATNCRALKEVIPGVVKETLHIAIECFEKVRRNKPILPIQSIHGFEMLYCGNNARRKPGQGNRIEAVNPLRSSPTGFLTDRPSSLSPVLRSRSLSPSRDFTTSVHSPTPNQRRITYQTPNQANSKSKNTSPSSVQSASSELSSQRDVRANPSRRLNSEQAKSPGEEQLTNSGSIKSPVDLEVISPAVNQNVKEPSYQVSASQNQSSKMPKLEERLMIAHKIYTRSHLNSPRSHIMPAMVGLWGTLPDLQRAETTMADAIKFRMTHVPQPGTGSHSIGKTSPQLYLTPKQSQKTSQSEDLSANNKRYKVSLTGIRMSESEKDLFVEAKNKLSPVLSDELTLLTDIGCKDSSQVENVGLRHSMRMARKSAACDIKCPINTARVADLSSELKAAKELVKLPNTIVQQSCKGGEMTVNDKGVDIPTHPQTKCCRYKPVLCDNAASATRMKLECYGRQKKASRVGAS